MLRGTVAQIASLGWELMVVTCDPAGPRLDVKALEEGAAACLDVPLLLCFRRKTVLLWLPGR